MLQKVPTEQLLNISFYSLFSTCNSKLADCLTHNPITNTVLRVFIFAFFLVIRVTLECFTDSGEIVHVKSL